MKSETNIHVGPSISISGLLGVAFVILKLCGVIAWSWCWVLAPFWIPVAFLVVGLLLIPLACIAAIGVVTLVKNLLFKK